MVLCDCHRSGLCYCVIAAAGLQGPLAVRTSRLRFIAQAGVTQQMEGMSVSLKMFLHVFVYSIRFAIPHQPINGKRPV